MIEFCKHGVLLGACTLCTKEHTKKEWQSLSDDEIRDIYKNYQRGYYEEDFFNFARAIEQALREKNHAD